MNYNIGKKANGVNGPCALRGRATAPGRGRVPTGQGLPRPSASETPKKIKIRIATWNVGTLNGKSREIVEVMRRRKIDVMCVQEVRWRGERARKLGDGYKIYYVGNRVVEME